MKQIDLSKYGINGVKEIVYNPSYELLFKEEMKAMNGYFIVDGFLRNIIPIYKNPFNKTVAHNLGSVKGNIF